MTKSFNDSFIFMEKPVQRRTSSRRQANVAGARRLARIAMIASMANSFPLLAEGYPHEMSSLNLIFY